MKEMNPCMLCMIDTKYKFIDLEICENQHHLFLSTIFWILLLFLLYINYFINHFRSATLFRAIIVDKRSLNPKK